MTAAEALALLAPARPAAAGATWADLGAGGGTFTRALAALLGAGGTVYAVDRDPRSVESLRALAARESRDAARVIVVEADFTRPLGVPASLDGLLLANALHFVPDAGATL
ncbi:MAG TPA: class I SAM-dependent methyltransferase, partial [Gemmatimonadaceae bacterium]|nr:class I SAM-dependent methyltransferase [Gemmatimonadaceae bacterium]